MKTGLKRKTKVEAEARRQEILKLVSRLQKKKFTSSRICKDNGLSFVTLHYWMNGVYYPSKKHLKKLNRYYLKVTTTKTKKQK